MYREKIKEMYKWKEQKAKIPLLVKGARRVGKTHLVQNFAKEAYKNLIHIFYINNHVEIIKNFKLEINISDVKEIEQFLKDAEPDTLIFIDDIEKFKQKKIFDLVNHEKKLDIIITSSILTENDFEFRIKSLRLNPLTFKEFLSAIGEKELEEKLLEEDLTKIQEYSAKYINNIKKYMYIGGMPEVVEIFSKNKDYRLVRQKQKEIIDLYMSDIEKENRMLANSLKEVWNVMIEQLKKENKEFDCREIKKGAQLPEYEPIVNILKNRGYVYKIDRVIKPGIPITAFRDILNFEIFPVDIGLLSCLLDIDLTLILKENEIFRIYNRILEKQFVIQELFNQLETQIYYWKETNMSYEIDFLIQYQAKIYPIKINLDENKLDSSLRWFHQKYQNYSEINLTFDKYKWQGWYTDVPIYLVGNIKSLLRGVIIK